MTSKLEFDDSILLTIAIPTYNRCEYLRRCLERLKDQVIGRENVELIIADNASTDKTSQVVSSFTGMGLKIQYYCHSQNIGPDKNFNYCYRQAKGKYIFMIGDDDLLLDGALEKILLLIQTGEYGLIFLKSYGFIDDFNLEKPRFRRKGKYRIYKDKISFMRLIKFYVTFISAFVVNRRYSGDEFVDKYLDNNLVQLGWMFPALINSVENAYIDELVVASKANNSGGYSLVKVFSSSFFHVIDFFISKGLSKKYIEIVRSRLASNFFPYYIYNERKSRSSFNKYEYFSGLKTNLSRHPFFWVFTVPAIVFPLPAVRILLNVTYLYEIFENVVDNIREVGLMFNNKVIVRKFYTHVVLSQQLAYFPQGDKIKNTSAENDTDVKNGSGGWDR